MFPGETPIQSCQRLLKRELKLEIEDDRFKPVCAQAFAFGMREQEPKEHGTTDTQFCYKVQVKNEDEVKKVVVDEEEYCESEWKLPSEILGGNFHPALKYAVASMLAGEALDELVSTMIKRRPINKSRNKRFEPSVRRHLTNTISPR